jgi:hypothetical protein
LHLLRLLVGGWHAVTPDSVYGQGCGFDFATAITLKLAPSFTDWRLRVEPVVVPKLAGK